MVVICHNRRNASQSVQKKPTQPRTRIREQVKRAQGKSKHIIPPPINLLENACMVVQ